MAVTIGRRELLAALGGVALAARSQQAAIPVVGFLKGAYEETNSRI